MWRNSLFFYENMNITNLESFLTRVKQKLDEKFPEAEKKLRVMSQQVKLSEEVGELAEQLLIRSGGQLHEKGGSNKEAIADEIADVIIVAGTIAHELDIPLEQALTHKMKKIKAKRIERISEKVS